MNAFDDLCHRPQQSQRCRESSHAGRIPQAIPLLYCNRLAVNAPPLESTISLIRSPLQTGHENHGRVGFGNQLNERRRVCLLDPRFRSRPPLVGRELQSLERILLQELVPHRCPQDARQSVPRFHNGGIFDTPYMQAREIGLHGHRRQIAQTRVSKDRRKVLPDCTQVGLLHGRRQQRQSSFLVGVTSYPVKRSRGIAVGAGKSGHPMLGVIRSVL